MKLYSLVTHYWIYQERNLEKIQRLMTLYIGILSEDYLMQMDLSHFNKWMDIQDHLSPWTMPLRFFWMLSQGDLIQQSMKVLEVGELSYRADRGVKDWVASCIERLHDTLKEKSEDLKKHGDIFLAKESDNIIPTDCQKLQEYEVIIEDTEDQDVYMVSAPKYGNYFDSDGLNHQNCGKTLSAIEAMEHLQEFKKWLWVGPKSALIAVQLDFKKWDAKVRPTFINYASLHKVCSV